MLNIHEGQCGLCTHFGEPHNAEPKLVQIRQKHKAPGDLVEECGHPKNATMHLMVTPLSGCTGFTPAKMN